MLPESTDQTTASTQTSMPAPSTIAEFVDLVRKSGVAEENLIDAYLEKQKSTGDMPMEPTRFAGQMVREGLLTYFQAEQFLQGKWKRFHIGKYKVLERLGAGGMGQVFLCEHKLMRRRVAVKVLPTARAEDPAALERFYREARAVAALDHPNLVRAFDIDQEDNLHFLVLEYVDGVNFQELVKKSGPLDPVRACHYIRQAAVGLDYAHQIAGLVHRDIKPGNILVDRTGVVKILDMGLARFFNDEADVLTRKFDEHVIGTADYLSPEQANDSHSADIRSDLYSLGATFYFILAGQPPYPEGSVAQKLIAHQTRLAKPVRDVRPDVPIEVAEIVEKLMRKSPNERYQSPAELDEALAPLTSTPIPPPPESEMPLLSLAATSGAGTMVVPVRRTAASANSNGRSLNGSHYRPSSSTILKKPSEHSQSPFGGMSNPNLAGATPSPSGGDTREMNSTNPFSHLLSSGMDSKAAGRSILESVYTPTASPKPAETSAVVEKPKSAQWMYLTAGALAALAVGMGIRMALSGGTDSKPPEKPPASEAKAQPAPVVPVREWTVDGTDGPDTVRTIAAAIRKARPGDRIVIRVPTIEETMVFDGKALGRGDITIESGLPGGEPVLWVPPFNASPSSPVVDIKGYAGATFRNIIFDGQNRVETMVRCTGSCPGTTFDRVHFRGCAKTALRLAHAVGDADRPIVVQNSRFQSSGQTENAIKFYSSATNQPVRHVRVANCSADGPFNSVLDGEGCASELTIERSRFYQAGAGLHWKRFENDQYLHIRLVNNTFVDMSRAAIHLESMPLESEASSMALRYTLAVKCGAVVLVDLGNRPGFIIAGSTVRDPGTADVQLPQPSRVESDITFMSTNPSTRDFLRYSKANKLASAGSDGSPVGAPPVD